MKITGILRTFPLVLAASTLPGAGCLVEDEESHHAHSHDATHEGESAIVATTGAEEYVHDPQENAVGEDLPSGTDVVWPADDMLTRALDNVLSVGGTPKIDYRRGATHHNSVMRIPEDLVRRTTTGGWSVVLDLGGLSVTVASYPVTTRGRLLLARGMRPDQVVLMKHYRASTSGGIPSLAHVALLDPGAPELGAVDGFDLSAGGYNASLDCEAQAWAEVAGEGLPNLSIVFPPVAGCSLADCVATKAAWIRANHDVYRVRQMIEFMNTASESQREWLWSQRAKKPDGTQAAEGTALSYWFGGYAKYRFDAIRFAYNRLWSDFHDLDLGGLNLDLECRPPSAGDICNSADPSAHHVVKSNVKLCDRFFDEKNDEDRARITVHELLHHVFVPWNNGTPRLDPIMDTHTHGHGTLCLSNVVTEKAYGVTKVRELATYIASNGNTCWHRNFAFRNNDSYAYAAMTIGGGVRAGTSKSWPFDFWPPGEGPGGGSYPVEPCSGLVGVDPGDGWSDPLNDCHKIGQEMVCPGGGGGGGVGPGSLDLDLTWECPEY